MTKTPGAHSHRARLRRLAGVMAVIALAGARSAVSQSVTAPALKAAILFNFAKFAEWPLDVVPRNAPVTMCVLGDLSISQALDETVKGRVVNGHEIVASSVKTDGALRSCHLLYVAGLDAKRATQILDSLAGAAVFTVSDLDGFAQLGGVAHLFSENDRMHFAINVEAAQRAHLRISSKLLALARIVKDDRYARQD